MDTTGLRELEQRIAQLPRDDQLWLIERLAHRLRLTTVLPQEPLESDLAAMAADPEIQRELRDIEEEFRGTESDGLENAE
jgi:hypothetical protein